MRNRVWDLFNFNMVAGYVRLIKKTNVEPNISQEDLNAYGDESVYSAKVIAKDVVQEPGKILVNIQVSPDRHVTYLFDVVEAIKESGHNRLGDILDDVTNSVEWLENLKWNDDWWKNAAALIDIAISLKLCMPSKKEAFMEAIEKNSARNLLNFVDTCGSNARLTVHYVEEFVLWADASKDDIAEMKAVLDKIIGVTE